MTDLTPLLALTMETAQVWAFLILTGASALGSLFSAWFAARAKANVKTVVTQAQANSDQLTEIHHKADTAIAQNDVIKDQTDLIKDQTDGHYTEMMRLLTSMMEAVKTKPATVVVPPAVVDAPRQVRKEDLQRATDAAKKDPA